MSSGKTIWFPLLNHTNYAEWALHMEAILIHGGFWDLIMGDEKLAEGELNEDRVKAFKKREAQCKADVVLRVNDSHQSMESWIREVRSLTNHFKAINVSVSNEDMIVVLTAGLC
ncbi:hypothetical protein L208DRAFT_1312216 [Tricholoma matsutake]|nr:hypothetical protein L208DRAFT_1312216 [Tricholoma matsutake 945]